MVETRASKLFHLGLTGVKIQSLKFWGCLRKLSVIRYYTWFFILVLYHNTTDTSYNFIQSEPKLYLPGNPNRANSTLHLWPLHVHQLLSQTAKLLPGAYQKFYAASKYLRGIVKMYGSLWWIYITELVQRLIETYPNILRDSIQNIYGNYRDKTWNWNL